MLNLSVRHIVRRLVEDGIGSFRLGFFLGFFDASSTMLIVFQMMGDIVQTGRDIHALRRVRVGALFQFDTLPTSARPRGVRPSKDDVFLVTAGISHNGGCTESRVSCLIMRCMFSAIDQHGREVRIPCIDISHIRFIDGGTSKER